MHHFPYSQSSYFPSQPQSGPRDPQNIQMPQFHQFQSNMPDPHQPMLGAVAQSHACSEMLQQDSIGRFQGLDINNRGGSHIVKPEGPSISAGETNRRFWLPAYPRSTLFVELFIDWPQPKVWYNLLLDFDSLNWLLLQFLVADLGLKLFVDSS